MSPINILYGIYWQMRLLWGIIPSIAISKNMFKKCLKYATRLDQFIQNIELISSCVVLLEYLISS